MAYAADRDMGAPYSLVCDVWDELEARDRSSGVILVLSAEAWRADFEKRLLEATKRYNGDATDYQFNARAVPED
jgi:hypothetical protein